MIVTSVNDDNIVLQMYNPNMCVCVCVSDSGVGTVYVSDDRGTVFSKSLERHLYTTTGSDTDFTVVTSLRGVYMTSALTEGGQTHSTLSIYIFKCWHVLNFLFFIQWQLISN